MGINIMYIIDAYLKFLYIFIQKKITEEPIHSCNPQLRNKLLTTTA